MNKKQSSNRVKSDGSGYNTSEDISGAGAGGGDTNALGGGNNNNNQIKLRTIKSAATIMIKALSNQSTQQDLLKKMKEYD